MNVAFTGNHVYKMPNMDAIIKHVDTYHREKQKAGGRMIMYSQDNYIHVIDGDDYVDFRKAEAMNRGLVPPVYLFEKLTAAYRQKATLVDFSDLQ